MKKLNLHEVEERLFSLKAKIFSPRDLQVIFGVSKRAIEGFLNYNVKKGVFTRVKRGLYTLKRNFPQEFVLANNLYFPSYVSLDSALSYYNLIPETIYPITSVTPKPTREFEVGGRLFEYRKIKKEAYGGYIAKSFNGEVAYLATPEKAVADFLYFVYLGKRLFNDRLKIERIQTQQLKKYLKLFNQKHFVFFVNRLLEKR